MTLVYLDSSVLIAYLYEEQSQPRKYEEARSLFDAIRQGMVEGVVSFYALPELYAHVEQYQDATQVNAYFRSSLVELFSLPLVIAPFLDRSDLKNLRQQFTISDPDDVRHAATAIFKKCDAIITFDHDFQQVLNLIPVYTPAEFLATLKPPESAPDSE